MEASLDRAFRCCQKTTPSMRRIVGLVLIGLILGTGHAVHGQPSPEFGATFGVNVATLEAPGDPGFRQMAAGGVVAQIAGPGPLSVQSQLLLNQKGALVRGEGGSIRYGAGYLDVPLLLRVKLPTLGPVTPYGVGGGFGGVKVFERERAGGDVSLPLPDRGPAFFGRTNGGLIAGLSGEIALGTGRTLNLTVRYAHGLVDVARSIPEQPYDLAPFPSTGETRTWSIMLVFGV